jgi:hypothetical protein
MSSILITRSIHEQWQFERDVAFSPVLTGVKATATQAAALDWTLESGYLQVIHVAVNPRRPMQIENVRPWRYCLARGTKLNCRSTA